MAQTAFQTPRPIDLVPCWACGAQVARVVLQRHRYRMVDPDPREGGEYVILRGGVRVLELSEEPRLAPDEQDRIPGEVRYFDHRRTCPVPSMRTCAAAIDDTVHWIEAKLDGDEEAAARYDPDPRREARRQRLLDHDQLRPAGGDAPM